MKVKLEFVRGIKFLVVNRFNDYTFLLWDMLIRTILSTDILLFVSRSAVAPIHQKDRTEKL